MSRGIWLVVGAYVAWGFLPVYWKQLHQVPAPQLLSHRIFWSWLALMAVIGLRKEFKSLWAALKDPRVWRVYLAASLLIAANWLTYVWAVNAGFIVETSLGYFINPLISVLLGVVFLRERLRPWQWLPIGLAAAGVLYLALAYGALPWIALTLAFSFGFYGLVKKTAPLGSFHGLALETGILLLPAMLYLGHTGLAGQGAFLKLGWRSDFLLAGAGLVTTIPLLMFASGAKRIPLTLMGFLQYIAPTLQFLLGVLVYREPFTRTQLAGYGLVWTALVLFAAEGYLAYRAKAAALARL